jgi:hypothetical protein
LLANQFDEIGLFCCQEDFFNFLIDWYRTSPNKSLLHRICDFYSSCISEHSIILLLQPHFDIISFLNQMGFARLEKIQSDFASRFIETGGNALLVFVRSKFAQNCFSFFWDQPSDKQVLLLLSIKTAFSIKNDDIRVSVSTWFKLETFIKDIPNNLDNFVKDALISLAKTLFKKGPSFLISGKQHGL